MNTNTAVQTHSTKTRNYDHLNTPKPEIKRDFDKTPRLRDVVLSSNAKNIYSYYLNKADGWNFNKVDANKETEVTFYSIRLAIRELQDNFLVIMERVKIDGYRYDGVKYHRFASPEDGRKWAKDNNRIDKEGKIITYQEHEKTHGFSKSKKVKTATNPQKNPAPEKQSKPAETRANSPAVDFQHVENRTTKRERSKERELVSEPPLSRREVINNLISKFQNDPVTFAFTLVQLNEYAGEYVDYCESKGSRYSVDGFRTKLGYKRMYQDKTRARLVALEHLAEARTDKLSALAEREQEAAFNIHSANISAISVGL